ncbi:glycosyltransferase [Methanobrevibacter millerae]|uniref:Glycosyl transferase family 2 n=1 Tax=Methanobrevibacter millerae TaxID=230361 RepID=A0A1G5WWH4_9EURY|nr:glycosyltransferase [Methanobrevibacter millerae]SDA62548.1 Glycosyl transferase family 2 [Methanobrevibacter millerae]
MYEISIIIPIFNVDNYLRRALNSILNQTMDLDDIEVIMVDDCSTDNSKNIIKEYADKYFNFIAIYHDVNSGGAARPRNTGLKKASGKYIMFLDPDDEYAEDMCETLFNKIEEKNVELVKCNHQMIGTNFSRLDYHYDKNIEELELDCSKDLPCDKVSVCNVIHNHQFLKNNNLYFEELPSGEDILFSITEFLNAKKMIYLNNYHGYKYHTNEETSHSMKSNEKNIESALCSFIKTKEVIESKNRPDILYHLFSKRSVPFFLRLLNYNGDKKKYLKKFYEFEKSLNVELNMEQTWLKILNKLIMKKQFTIASYYMNFLNMLRNSPILTLYRKSL